MTPTPAGWKPRLSCPFCGSTCLFTVPDEHGSGGQWVPPIHVGCNDCQAEQVADTEDEAVERWNRRSSPASVAPGDAQGDPIGTLSRDADDMICFTPARDFHVTDGMLVFSAPAAGDAQTNAARDVLAERQRQISDEGCTPQRDDEYTGEELARAAVCYALPQGDYEIPEPPEFWPWPMAWWKPGERRRELVKAGALILAEIERLDRAAIAAQQGKGGE